MRNVILAVLVFFGAARALEPLGGLYAAPMGSQSATATPSQISDSITAYADSTYIFHCDEDNTQLTLSTLGKVVRIKDVVVYGDNGIACSITLPFAGYPGNVADRNIHAFRITWENPTGGATLSLGGSSGGTQFVVSGTASSNYIFTDPIYAVTVTPDSGTASHDRWDVSALAIRDPVTKGYVDSTFSPVLGGFNGIIVNSPNIGIDSTAIPHAVSWYETEQGTAGENLTGGDLVWYKSDSKWYRADADTSVSVEIRNARLGIIPVSISSAATGTIVTRGQFTTSGLTSGSLYYMSQTTGAITATAPTAAGSIRRRLGNAKGTTVLVFNPSLEYIGN